MPGSKTAGEKKGRKYIFLRELADNVGLLGLGMVPYVAHVFLAALTKHSAFADTTFYISEGLLLLLVGALFYRKKQIDSYKESRSAFLLGGFALLCTGLVLLLVCLGIDNELGWYLATIIGSGGIACGYLQWFSCYRDVKLKIAIFYVCLSFILAASLRLIFAFVPETIGIILAIPLALGAQLLYHFVIKKRKLKTDPAINIEQESEKDISFKEKTIPFMIILIIYSLILAFLRAIYAEDQFITATLVINSILRILMALAIIGIVYLSKLPSGFSGLVQIVLVFIATTILVIHLMSGDSSVFGVAFMSAVRGLLILMLHIAIVLTIHKKNRHPFAAIGLGWGTFIFCIGLGAMIPKIFDLQYLSSGMALAAVYIAVVFTVIGLLLSRKKGTKAVVDTKGKTNSTFSVEARYQELIEEYELTDREADVMILLSKGHSKRHIASSLLISENTVRAYSKTLYSKLDIHSKQSLLDLLYEKEEGPVLP